MMATAKQRTRYFTFEEIARGFASPINEAQDLPQTERARMVAEIANAYEAGQLAGKQLHLARLVGQALSTSLPTLAALRVQLGTDGREMADRVRTVARVVPALWSLINWIAI